MIEPLRAKAPGMVGALLIALLLQFAGPLPGLFGKSLFAQASSELVVICSEGGVHYLHLDGTPADDQGSTDKNAPGDCCTPACHFHGALLSAPVTVAPLTQWVRRFADTAPFAHPKAAHARPFQARAPPLTA